MDENNVNGFRDTNDDDYDEGTTVLTTPGVNAYSAPQRNNQPVGQQIPQSGGFVQPQGRKPQPVQYSQQPDQMQYGGFGQPQGQNMQPGQMQYGGFGQPQEQNMQPGQMQYGGFGQPQGQNMQPGQMQYGGFGQPQGQNMQPGQMQYGGFGQPQGQNMQPDQTQYGGFGQPQGQNMQPDQMQYGEFGQQQYGQPASPFGLPGSQPNMEAGKKINKKLIAIIGGIAAAVIIVIIVLAILLSGGGERSARKVGDKLISAYEKGDADAMVDLMNDDYYELYNKVRSLTGSDDYVKDTFNEQVDDMVDDVGKVKDITVENRNEEEYDKAQLDDVNATLDVMNIDMKVDECMEITLDVKIKGADDNADGKIVYTVVKSGGKWYLVDYDLYIY